MIAIPLPPFAMVFLVVHQHFVIVCLVLRLVLLLMVLVGFLFHSAVLPCRNLPV